MKWKIFILIFGLIISVLIIVSVMFYSFYKGMNDSNKKYFKSELIESEIRGAVMEYYRSELDDNIFKIRCVIANGDSFGIDICGEQSKKNGEFQILKGDSIYKEKDWDYIIVYSKSDTIKLNLNYCY